MNPLVVHVDGIGFWSRCCPGWSLASSALRSAAAGAACSAGSPASTRPAPTLLAANERRRAPDSVLLALQVAEEAVAGSGHAAADLASIYSSAYGDLPIVDALCRTLAAAPLQLSPTRFHHSVHNAASGYWAIGSGSRAASSALAADRHSFASGLLEAATTCVADHRDVLLVAYDTEACGPLASVTSSRGLLGVALVLACERGPHSQWHAAIDLVAADEPPSRAESEAARRLQDNAQADALPLYEALAAGRPARLRLAISEALQLRLALEPCAPRA